MKMKRAGSVALVGLFLLVAPLAAKGPTVKLTVTGASLTHPVDITSGKALDANIWAGDFLGAPASEPEASLPRYTVSFFAAPPRQPVAVMAVMYVVQLALDTRSGEGFVYLPGEGDSDYRTNIHTILRDGQDGKWHRATPQWSGAIAQALRK
jgi:hypothetical protein